MASIFVLIHRLLEFWSVTESLIIVIIIIDLYSASVGILKVALKTESVKVNEQKNMSVVEGNHWWVLSWVLNKFSESVFWMFGLGEFQRAETAMAYAVSHKVTFGSGDMGVRRLLSVDRRR